MKLQTPSNWCVGCGSLFRYQTADGVFVYGRWSQEESMWVPGAGPYAKQVHLPKFAWMEVECLYGKLHPDFEAAGVPSKEAPNASKSQS